MTVSKKEPLVTMFASISVSLMIVKLCMRMSKVIRLLTEKMVVLNKRSHNYERMDS